MQDEKKRIIEPVRSEGIIVDARVNSKREGFHILVVDDDALIRHILPRALKGLGVSVEVAENGLQAQRKILAGNFNLVITDINMPGMSGVDLLRWLSKYHPQVEGMAMTAYDLADDLTREMLGRVSNFFTKPFSITLLQEAVKASMELQKKQEEKRE